MLLRIFWKDDATRSTRVRRVMPTTDCKLAIQPIGSTHCTHVERVAYSLWTIFKSFSLARYNAKQRPWSNCSWIAGRVPTCSGGRWRCGREVLPGDRRSHRPGQAEGCRTALLLVVGWDRHRRLRLAPERVLGRPLRHRGGRHEPGAAVVGHGVVVEAGRGGVPRWLRRQAARMVVM